MCVRACLFRLQPCYAQSQASLLCTTRFPLQKSTMCKDQFEMVRGVICGLPSPRLHHPMMCLRGCRGAMQYRKCMHEAVRLSLAGLVVV
jgi:hypothetical protein